MLQYHVIPRAIQPDSLMNSTEFSRLLEQLKEADWRQVIEGQSVLMVDDLRLAIGPAQSPNAIVRAPEESETDFQSLRDESIEEAASLLTNYYLTHPLTQIGFNHQVTRLMEKYAPDAFAAPPGQFPRYTLFVDEGEVVAEASGSPRHRYGVYCELPRSLMGAALDDYVGRWLHRGEAHERYLSMNVCRYNC